MFRANVIARRRLYNDRNLPNTATVKAPVRSDLGGGNYREDFDELFSAPCRVAPSDVGASPNEHVLGGADQSQTRWWVIFAWDVQEKNPEIKVDYLIDVTGQDHKDGPTWTKKLEVLAVMDKRSNRIQTKVLCMERR